MTQAALTGRRVMIVEDELLIAMLIESMLDDENCTVVGPYAAFDVALAAAGREALDAAVLDINLGGQMVFPVGDALEERGIPFLLMSGYGDLTLPSNRRHWPVCVKPVRNDELISTLTRLVTNGFPTPKM